jgi:hypothetical protein
MRESGGLARANSFGMVPGHDDAKIYASAERETNHDTGSG